ncbi:CHAT domain-containing protein [Lentzea sp. BCCO 10_0856]|uniref:CHAT domain-containing protein n=1 Tax=Lentzea miocenica TaxID=3095431 RepID=A0ABU4SWH3_9PSEU|nr:CHAT domain-containing protein [Lentzea sp. BCCO 10_0856]MDX8030273.1 CHAT domain-containing protein [Lentzea sp. BCCO 10_0856]
MKPTREDRVRRMREEGSLLTNSGKPGAGARKLRAALRLLDWSPETSPDLLPLRVLTSHVLISLGLAEAELGDTARGLATLDAAERVVTDQDRPILWQQRALVLHRAGRVTEALRLLDAAVPRLTRAGVPFPLTSALLTRVAIGMGVGRTGRAREDLRVCGEIAAREGFALTEAKVAHALGYCAVLDDDIPSALRSFEEAAGGYAEHGPGYLPVLAMDKARALLSAGLAAEAGRELDSAFAMFTADRFSVDYAWAELTRAQAALATGQPDVARDWAVRAGRRFRRHGDHAWAAIADLTAMRARLATGRSVVAAAARCGQLADRLRGLGLDHDAELADLLAARALLEAGRPVGAVASRGGSVAAARGLGGPVAAVAGHGEPVAVVAGRDGSIAAAAGSGGPVATEASRDGSAAVAASHGEPVTAVAGRDGTIAAAASHGEHVAGRGEPVTAEASRGGSVAAVAVRGGPVAAVAGRGGPIEVRLLRRLVRARQLPPGPALRELRSGLDLLQAQRSRWGSTELRAALATTGADLAVRGLDLALTSGSPRLVFSWTERCRAQSFRLTPVRPPADPVVREALAELRQLNHNLREVRMRGGRDPATRARCTELERVIRQRTWQWEGDGTARRAVSVSAVQAQLGQADQVMVSFFDRADRLFALVADRRQVRLVPLGRTSAVVETVVRLLNDLDVVCGRRLPARLEAAVSASIDDHVRQLSADVVAPLCALLGDRDVVIVPTKHLSVLPWGLLPEFRGRPVTVALSASTWSFGRQAAGAPVRAGALLASGPRLHNAEKEIIGISAIHPAARSLTGAAATVEAVLDALDGVDVAHLVAHGHHEPDNVLFSCLDLADGPLMAYDLARLKVAPRHVVLSACDVGQATVRAGDEALGFTAALLHSGTSSVIASVARVPDDLAVDVMSAYHRALTAGATPARALADASPATSRIPLLCFGAG